MNYAASASVDSEVATGELARAAVEDETASLAPVTFASLDGSASNCLWDVKITTLLLIAGGTVNYIIYAQQEKEL